MGLSRVDVGSLFGFGRLLLYDLDDRPSRDLLLIFVYCIRPQLLSRDQRDGLRING